MQGGTSHRDGPALDRVIIYAIVVRSCDEADNYLRSGFARVRGSTMDTLSLIEYQRRDLASFSPRGVMRQITLVPGESPFETDGDHDAASIIPFSMRDSNANRWYLVVQLSHMSILEVDWVYIVL